jgi:formate C-acetyltransferase
MVKNGYSIKDARDYTAVGCVEPVSQGKSFSSTDAAIFNVPLTLEMALNGGRRFGHVFRSGADTKPFPVMGGIDEVYGAFTKQLTFKTFSSDHGPAGCGRGQTGGIIPRR